MGAIRKVAYMPYANRQDGLAQRRRWYAANKRKFLDWNNLVRARKKLFIKSKLTRCIRCGFDDKRSLVFHHREPESKFKALSRMSSDGWQRIRDEISKCDVLCLNCHSIAHYELRARSED